MKNFLIIEMTQNNSILLIAITILGVSLLSMTIHSAYAHMSFDVKTGANANQTIRITLGETKEPSYVDEEHNLEMTIVHKLTNLQVGNAHLSQTSTTMQKMFVDTYFYPVNVLVTNGVPAMTSCDAGAGNPADCVPGVGYTDSRTAMNLSPISVNDGGVAGQYRQATRQLYTEQGRTLYHIYGELNYFNDTGIGPIPINIWTDGANIKKASWCEGMAANKAACISGDTTYNKTLTPPSSGFGLANRTSVYWPDTATENTHPSNIRKAVGSIRDNTFDIWNVLEEITDALRTVTGFGTVQDHVPRNSTNSGAPSSYTYP